MITINYSPLRVDSTLEAQWTAPVLTVNGVDYDLSLLDDGDRATQHPVLGDVERNGNDYTVTLRLPHGANAPYTTRFPTPVVMASDGVVDIPAFNKEEV